MKNQLFDLCNALKKWRRCITKETTSQKWDRYLDESGQLLTNEEVQEILSSKPAVDGRSALVAADAAKDSDDLSMKQYCDARDYLIVSLTRAVGTRPGALENATLDMFRKALWDDAKRKKVMVAHKRDEDSPAPIPMSPDIEYAMNVFIDKLRPLVTEDTSARSKIFLKNDGAPFHKGTIGRRVRAFVVKSGIRPDKKISATDFQKWIVTELKRKKRRGEKIDEQLLRCLMCHSDKTANEWYLRENLTEEAAKASMLIEKHTQAAKKDVSLPEPLKKRHREEKESGPQEAAEASVRTEKHTKPAKADVSLPEPSKKQHREEKGSAPQDIVSSPKANSATSARTGSSEKTSLSTAERKQVDKTFADDIRSGVEPRKKRVVALMKSNLVLRGLVHSEIHVKRVIDQVRYLFDNSSIVNPYELPEEPAAKQTAVFVAEIPDRPPSTIESGRVEWSSEETEAIQEALTFWTKLPSKNEIQAMFQSNVLRDIFRNNTFDRIRNKVKNEYCKKYK